MVKWKRNNRKYVQGLLLGIGMLLVVACWQSLESAGDAPALVQMWEYLQDSAYVKIFKTYMPAMTYSMEYEAEKPLREYVMKKVTDILPIYSFTQSIQDYETEVESRITYEMIVAREGVDENYKDGELVADSEKAEKDEEANQEENEQPEEDVVEEVAQVVSATEPAVQISLDKLNDFDYLIQNFYQVDRTTTINSSQLNAQTLLEKDLRLTGGNENPQILIFHTHSQEGYSDSAGDASGSVVGVGEYLTQLLRDNYGLNVIHHTGEYDVIKRDNAYSYAGPALEQLLAENPSIEVVIDLHRDAVGDTHLVSEVNGKQTAKIMFFNGLSRTTSNGDIAYLPNQYLEDNLAFSFQMKLKAEQYYPGFTRANYLKGYRYNMHYCPRSLLVEVGSDTNTVQEAMNAMEPLADLLHKVLVSN